MGGRSMFASIVRGAGVELRQPKQPWLSPAVRLLESILGLEPED